MNERALITLFAERINGGVVTIDDVPGSLRSGVEYFIEHGEHPRIAPRVSPTAPTPRPPVQDTKELELKIQRLEEVIDIILSGRGMDDE